jgi:hypothetical protein
MVVVEAWEPCSLAALRLTSREWCEAVGAGLRECVERKWTPLQRIAVGRGALGLCGRVAMGRSVTKGEVWKERPALSVCCDLDENGRTQWVVLTESGMLPECEDLEKHKNSCGTKMQATKFTRGYLCAQSLGEKSREVIFGELCMVNWRRLTERIVPAAELAGCGGRDLMSRGRVLRAAALGGFACEEAKCTCCKNGTYVCRECEPPNWGEEDGLWLKISRFRRVKQYGGEDWFLGVSDAPGRDATGVAWMRCPFKV